MSDLDSSPGNTPISEDSVRLGAPSLNDGQVDYGMLADLTGFPLKLAWVTGYAQLLRTIKDPGITPQRFSMLELIGTNPGLPQTRLGNALGLSRPATSLAIDFWQLRGCVERRTAPSDRRSFGIYLAEKGRKLLDRLRERVREADEKLTKRLTPGEIAELRSLLAKIHG